MRKTWVLLALVLALTLAAATALGSVYGGREDRAELVEQQRQKMHNQMLGDQGGQFTAALNKTQPVYYLYDWDYDWYGLGYANSGNIYYSWTGGGDSSGTATTATTTQATGAETTTAGTTTTAALTRYTITDSPSAGMGFSGGITAEADALAQSLAMGNITSVPTTGTYELYNDMSNNAFVVTWNNGVPTVTPR